MKIYKIFCDMPTMVTIEAKSKKEAIEKFTKEDPAHFLYDNPAEYMITEIVVENLVNSPK